jgi:hypothetical protein
VSGTVVTRRLFRPTLFYMCEFLAELSIYLGEIPVKTLSLQFKRLHILADFPGNKSRRTGTNRASSSDNNKNKSAGVAPSSNLSS